MALSGCPTATRDGDQDGRDYPRDPESFGQPALLAAVERVGDDGVDLQHVRYRDSFSMTGVSPDLLLIIGLGAPTMLRCLAGSVESTHLALYGNITVIPPDQPYEGVAAGPTDAAIVRVPHSRLALAAGVAGKAARLSTPTLQGQDRLLLSVVEELVQEALHGPTPAQWHGLIDELADRLVERYCSEPTEDDPRLLSSEALTRLGDHLDTNLDSIVPVEELASVVGEGQWRFSRMFRRTLGVSPHQYAIRLRLKRARDLIARGTPLAEAAVATGFTDQSHLTYWVKRAYATTPARFRRGVSRKARPTAQALG